MPRDAPHTFSKVPSFGGPWRHWHCTRALRSLRDSGALWSLQEFGTGRPESDATVAAGKFISPAARERGRRLARGMNLDAGSRGAEFGMSAVSCGNGKLRQWLIDQIDSGKYPGLVWENEEKSVFRIPWKHAGKQDYNREEDAALFKVTSTGDPRAGESGERGEASQTALDSLCLQSKGPGGRRSGGPWEAETRPSSIRSCLTEAAGEGKEAASSPGITQTENRVPTLSLCGGKYFQLQEHPRAGAVVP